MPDDRFERALGYPSHAIAGVDEVGRGPLAGPVIAAAVILPAAGLSKGIASQVNDSKKLPAKVRETLAQSISEACPTAIGMASEAEIDEINILQASLLAMRRAIKALPNLPDAVLIDGNRCPPDLPCHAQTVVKGDTKCLSIAAASIIAKVHRDKIMVDLAARWPGYGWESNAGYPTAQHRAALVELGVTPHHRRSFAPVSQQLGVTT
ncbi:MAG: ribonuclease HII [Pseudomonadota bacterium]